MLVFVSFRVSPSCVITLRVQSSASAACPQLRITKSSAYAWGILMAAAGLMSWFTAVIIVVRFIPHRIGLTFFRLVNAILGLILLGFAAFCGILLSRHFLH